MIGKGFLSSKKPLRAVDDVSLKINRGQVFAVVGESGCGKTTLARMLLGLLEPTEGEIYLDGQPISEVSLDMISRKVQPVSRIHTHHSIHEKQSNLSFLYHLGSTT